VLVARMPDPLGRACIFPGDSKPSVTVVDVCIIRPDAKKHDLRWLMHCLNGPASRNQIARYATGTTRSRISRGNLGKIRIPLPPLSQQQRIAEVLDKADALRAKRRAALGQLDVLTQSIFLNMFGHPAENTKALPTIALSDLGDWQSGGTPPRERTEYFGGTVPWFSSGELDQMYLFQSKERVTASALLETSAKPVPLGSLMLGMYDSAALKAGIAGVDCSCNQAVAFARIDNQVAESIYVYFAIVVGREHFRRQQRGVRQKNLNLTMVREIQIPLPSLDLQRRFAVQVDEIRRLKDRQLAAIIEMDALFACLQHRAFRGEL
jgi:type I restriction enzyme S subunit